MTPMIKAFRGFWLCLAAVGWLLFLSSVTAEAAEGPIRVALVGLVHGHAKGFLRALPGNGSATLVAVVEPRGDLAKGFEGKVGVDSKPFFTDLERGVVGQHPDSGLWYRT